MKKILAILSLALASTAFAQNQPAIDVSKLTPEQIAQINRQVAEMANQPTNISANVRKEAEAWGELGTNMGRAMVGAAKEVGVAANEFSQTPLGKVVVFLAVYKIIGQEILGVVIGSLILVVGYSVALWLLFTRRWSNVQYEYSPTLWGIYNRKRVISCKTDNEIAIAKIIGAGILTLLTTVVGLNTIF